MNHLELTTTNNTFSSKSSTSNSFRSQIMDFNLFQQLNSNDYYLNRYRKYKANESLSVSKQQQKGLLPSILCKIFDNFGNDDGKKNIKGGAKCGCPKTDGNYCSLIINLIQKEYFWKTDRQFYRAYQKYTSQEIQQQFESETKFKLQQKLNILGLKLTREQINSLMQILTNYQKHTIYFSTFSNTVQNSDIYIWVLLGIAYHMGFSELTSNQTARIISFWSLNIFMNNLGSLTQKTFFEKVTTIQYRLQHYFGKWMQFLQSKKVKMRHIVCSWVNEMMFGYMGVEYICFFLDFYQKTHGEYLFKIILSYFQNKTKNISKNKSFLEGRIQTEELYQLLLDGYEQWPMVFCFASSFVQK